MLGERPRRWKLTLKQKLPRSVSYCQARITYALPPTSVGPTRLLRAKAVPSGEPRTVIYCSCSMLGVGYLRPAGSRDTMYGLLQNDVFQQTDHSRALPDGRLLQGHIDGRK